MHYAMYAVKDALVGFGVPFASNSNAEAIRAFVRVATDTKSDIFASPGDYDLYYIGTYDTDTGLLTSTIPDMIYRGRSAVVRKEVN